MDNVKIIPKLEGVSRPSEQTYSNSNTLRKSFMQNYYFRRLLSYLMVIVFSLVLPFTLLINEYVFFILLLLSSILLFINDTMSYRLKNGIIS